MNKRLDIMVDLETLGRDPQNPVIQIGAIAFDVVTGAKYSEFVEYCILDAKVTPINPDTYKWWLDTNTILLQDLLKRGLDSGITEAQMFERFVKWIEKTAKANGIAKGDVHLWGNGILFDNYIIRGKCEMYGLKYPIPYQNDKDVRTIVDAYCTKAHMTRNEVVILFKNASGLVQHDAINDCQIQINMVRHCYTTLTR